MSVLQEDVQDLPTDIQKATPLVEENILDDLKHVHSFEDDILDVEREFNKPQIGCIMTHKDANKGTSQIKI